MILLIGTPCSGKSTIGYLLSEATNKRLVTLDVFIQKLVSENNIKEGEILTDEFIDTAVKEFFNHMDSYATKETLIYELPYHDYSQLFRNENIPSQVLIFGFHASYQKILERNSKRKLTEQIPIKYLERSYNSMQKTIENESKRIHFFDTEEKTAESILSEILTLIRKYD